MVTTEDAVAPAPPTVGWIVHYRLNEYDAVDINRRRDDFAAFQRLHRSDPSAYPAPGDAGATGHVAHVGNRAAAGQVYPAVVVATWGTTPGCAVNLQVVLDGTDTYWATSRCGGDADGQWSWPPRV